MKPQSPDKRDVSFVKVSTEEQALAAVKNDPQVFSQLPNELKTEKVCLAAVKTDYSIIHYMTHENLTREICLAAYQQSPSAIRYVPESLRELYNKYTADERYKASVKEVKELQAMSKQGDAEAQFRLGRCLDNGEEALIDEDKAVYWYTKSAEGGYHAAQFLLGCLYHQGEGIPKDLEKAVYWYTKSAEQGDFSAQVNLGFCYYYGEGVSKDREKAVCCFIKAANEGDYFACQNLQFCYYNGEGVQKDLKKAAYWQKFSAGRLFEEDNYEGGIYYYRANRKGKYALDFIVDSINLGKKL